MVLQLAIAEVNKQVTVQTASPQFESLQKPLSTPQGVANRFQHAHTVQKCKCDHAGQQHLTPQMSEIEAAFINLTIQFLFLFIYPFLELNVIAAFS